MGAITGLLDPDGIARGFYQGGIAWLDPDARGKGLSALLILAAADILGGRPTGEHSGIGYSAAGIAAHLSALRKACTMACDAGYDLRRDDGLPENGL